MPSRYDSNQVLEVLKQALKKKNVTYADLGERLLMSESGIKKVMGAEDVSLTRLAQICGAADLDLMAILEAAWKAPPSAYELSDEQLAFFRAHPAVYDFFMALLTCHLDAAEVGRRYDLDQPSIVRYLGKLEDVGLIEQLPGGRVTCVVPAPYRTRGDAGLHQDKHRFLDLALGQTAADGRHLTMAGVRMTKESFQAFKVAMRDLVLEWGVKAHQEELTRADAELIDVYALTAIARCRHSDLVAIPRLPTRPGGSGR